MSIRKSALSSSLFIAGTGLGFFNFLLITRRFGIGGLTDAYFLCHALGELLLRLLLCQEFMPAYLARYHEAKVTGRSRASLSATLLWLAALLGPLTLAGIWAAPILVDTLAPGLAQETARLTTLLLRWNLAAILLQYLAQPLIAACYTEGESWVEPASLLLLTVGVTGAVLAPSGSLLLAVQLHVAGFFAMTLLALWRLGRADAAPGALQSGDFSAAAAFFRSLLPLGSMVITRSLFRWGYTALLSGFPAGVITLVNFGEKIFGAGLALLSQGYARITIPGLLRPEAAGGARRAFLADSAYFSALLGAALFATADAIPILAFSALTGEQQTLCRDLLRAFALTVFIGGFWECARNLGLALRHNRAVTVSASVSHLLVLGLMFAAWHGLGGFAARPPALPLYFALACLVATVLLIPVLRKAAFREAGDPAGRRDPGGWLALAMLPITGLITLLFFPAMGRSGALALLVMVSLVVAALFWRRLRQSAGGAIRPAAKG